MKVLIIGRDQTCDIVINDTCVNPFHAQIIKHDNGTVTVVDLGSALGTFVNGNRISTEHSLKSNDELRIGNNQILWQQWLKINNGPHMLILTLIPASLIIAVSVLLICLSIYNRRVVTYDNRYPAYADFEEMLDGEICQFSAVSGQCILVFDYAIPFRKEQKLIKKNGGIVVAQNPQLHYYLVATEKGREASFINQMSQLQEVKFVSYNTREELKSTDVRILDNYPKSTLIPSHGEMVSKLVGESNKNSLFNIEENHIGHFNLNEVLEYIAAQLNNNSKDLKIFTLAIGPQFSAKTTMWNDLDEKTSKSFKHLYINELKSITKLISNCSEANFLIVKAAGNEGITNMEENVLKELFESLTAKEQHVYANHILLAGVNDSRYSISLGNDIKTESGVRNFVRVDISGQPVSVSGSSASAAIVSGWLAELGADYEMDASELIDALTVQCSKSKDITFDKLKESVSEMPIKIVADKKWNAKKKWQNRERSS